MKVMQNHSFFDADVIKVLNDGHENNKEIVLSVDNENSFIINKEDVIALAKEFDLIVFEKDSRL